MVWEHYFLDIYPLFCSHVFTIDIQISYVWTKFTPRLTRKSQLLKVIVRVLMV